MVRYASFSAPQTAVAPLRSTIDAASIVDLPNNQENLSSIKPEPLKWYSTVCMTSSSVHTSSPLPSRPSFDTRSCLHSCLDLLHRDLLLVRQIRMQRPIIRRIPRHLERPLDP